MNLAEQAFYAHLTNADSLDYIVKEGFTGETSLEVIPTEVGRKLTTWAIKYYFDSGRTVAPSKDAIMMSWGDQLEPLEITIDDDVETDSIQWAIAQMRSDYADYMAGVFAKSMVQNVRDADGPARAEVVLEHSQMLHVLSQSLISRRNEVEGAEGISDALKRYEERLLDGTFKGLCTGLPEVDNHIMGIHDGEMAVCAGTSGGGKSWWSIVMMLADFKRGRRTALFTLENDIEMTMDRIACVEARVDYEKWQRAECSPGDVDRVHAFLDILKEANHQPLIIQPELSEATGASMIRRAVIEDCNSVIIDQLSHIEPVVMSKARQRNEVIAEIIRDLVRLINQPGSKLPLALMHQINRKGREEARKSGRYLMEHLGEATQVENGAKFVFAIYQSPDHVIAEQAELQMLKATRVVPKDWEITWRPALGDVRVRREITRD